MKDILLKTLNSFKETLPMIFGILLAINLISPFLQRHYANFFTGNYAIDSFLGALVGSISFGIPITSYVAGGEFLNQGVSLIAVTAFILTWSTVGIVMLPLEASFLGKKFAIVRNSVNFIFAIVIAVLTTVTLKFFQ